MQFLATEWFWAMIQAIGAIAALVFIARQIRLQTSTHVVETLGAIHERWSEEAMLRARHSVCERYLRGDADFDIVSDYIAEFMEELGTYVKMKAVPPAIMWDAQSWYIEHYYPMFKVGIDENRQCYHEDSLYENFRDLFALMKKESKKRAAPVVERGPEDIRRFAEEEFRVTAAFIQLQSGVVPRTESPGSDA